MYSTQFRLAQLVFENEEARRALNKITHPVIRNTMLRKMYDGAYGKTASLKSQKPIPYVLVDAPLLFETPYLKHLFGVICVVKCSKSQQEKRLHSRNPELSEAECRNRIQSQMRNEEKVLMADPGFVIDNDKPLKDLSATAEKTHMNIDSLVNLKVVETAQSHKSITSFFFCFFFCELLYY